MTSEQARFRLKIAVGFVDEGRQDIQLARWRSAVDNAQLAVENAAKAVLALIAPVGRTHNPAPLLREALERGQFPAALKDSVRRLAECAEVLGFDVHVQTDYGDETEGLTPWDLFSEEEARRAFALAEEAAGLAENIIREARNE